MHAAIDANKNGGIPLGGWTNFENDTAPNTEWLQAGTTFDSDAYPELFLYLGGNTVPERYDHSRLGDYQAITLPTSSATAMTMQYDGVLHYVPHSINRCYIYINGQQFYADDGDDSSYSSSSFSFNAGDVIYATVNGREFSKIAYYTHPMFIKATTTASSYTPSTAVQEIKDYTKDYVDAKMPDYSITEQPTGRKWIDGKPTYMIVFSGTSLPSSGTVLQTNVDTLIQQYGSYSNSTTQIPLPYNSGDTKCELRGNKNNNNLYIQYSSMGSSVVKFNFFAEYTKTTD